MCWFMAQELKVVAIPPSEVRFVLCRPRITNVDFSILVLETQFYIKEHWSIGERFARFAFVSVAPGPPLFPSTHDTLIPCLS